MSSESDEPPDKNGYQVEDDSAVASDATLPAPVDTDLPPINSRVFGENGDYPIKIVGPNNEEIVAEDLIVAPDGGWGWIIVIAAFMSNFFVDGTVYSIGILTEFIANEQNRTGTLTLDELNGIRTELGWVGGMLVGFQFVAGPFVSSLANFFGFRITAIAGSFTTFIGFLLAWLINRNGEDNGPNLASLYGCVGFLGGVGLCLLYVPAIITVGYYFDEKRSLANGIAVCGSGIGTFVYAPLIAVLLDELGWPRTLIIEGGLLFSSIFLVVLYRPLKPVKRTPPDWTTEIENKSVHEADSGIPIEDQSFPDPPKPGASEVSGLVVSDNGGVKNKKSKEAVRNQIGDQPISAGRSTHSIGGFERKQNQSPPLLSATSSRMISASARSIGGTARPITLLVNPSYIGDIGDSRIFRVASTSTLNKPLHHPDIFSRASPAHTDKADESAPPGVELEAVPISIAESQMMVQPPPKKNCCKRTFEVLGTLLDFSLLKSLSFITLAMSGLTTLLGFYIPFGFIPALAIQQDAEISPTKAASLVSFIGVANIIGSALCGYLGSKAASKVLLINNIAITVVGIATAVVPFSECYQILAVYSLLFGFCGACFISLRPILVVQFMGINNLTNAFGLLCVFHGAAAFVSFPLGGILTEAKGLNFAFHVAGALMVVSAFMCYPLNIINNWERKHSKRLGEEEPIRVPVQ